MTYTKPQLLNVKSASVAIMGQPKPQVNSDGAGSTSTASSYRSDE